MIHQIVFYGKGGYDFNSVYNMPIWLRKYTFIKKLINHYKEEKEAMKMQKAETKGIKHLLILQMVK